MRSSLHRNIYFITCIFFYRNTLIKQHLTTKQLLDLSQYLTEVDFGAHDHFLMLCPDDIS